MDAAQRLLGSAHDPILKPLDTIECRDAILTPDDTEPDWPEADVVIGNPPFLGTKLQIRKLGENYVSRLRSTYTKRLLARADLVCYWFTKAGRQIASGKAATGRARRDQFHSGRLEPARAPICN